jgi:hypothetical protein
MTSTELRDEQRLAILKHLATGKSTGVVATITHVPQAQVVDVARNHGYPDKDKLAWAAEIVEKKINDERRTGLPAGSTERGESVDSQDSHATAPSASTSRRPPAPSPTTAPQAAAPPSTPRVDEQATTSTKPDEFRILINTAKNHDRKKIQTLATKILDDCAKLRGWIDAEAAAFKARQEEAAAKEKARAEVKRAEEQLAAAKAALRGISGGDTVADSDDGPSPAAVRAWAAENSIDCPSRGRLPAEVRQAYDEAHAELADAS